MLEIQDIATLGIMVINIVLAAALLFIYFKSYRVVKSKMTLGLMFFAFAFLLQTLVHLYFYETLISQAIIGFTTIHFAVNVLEMIGLLILLYVTWK